MTAPTPHRTPRGKKTLAVIAAAVGGLVVLVSLIDTTLGTLLIGLAIGLPGAWYLLHERRARATSGPQLKRHWGIVGAVCAGLVVIGSMLVPPPEEPAEAVTAETTTPSTATSSVETSHPTAPTSTHAEPTSTETTVEEPPAVMAPAPVEPTPEPEPYVPPADETPAQMQGFVAPPVPAPAPAPAPAAEQAPAPAPAPAPSGNVRRGQFCRNAQIGEGAQATNGQWVTCTVHPSDNRARWS